MAKSPWWLKMDPKSMWSRSAENKVTVWFTIHPLYRLWLDVLNGFGLLRRAA